LIPLDLLKIYKPVPNKNVFPYLKLKPLGVLLLGLFKEKSKYDCLQSPQALDAELSAG
jgi:hypothetical protein